MSRFGPRNRPGLLIALACAASAVVAARLCAQTPPGAVSEAPLAERVPIEVFKGPRLKSIDASPCTRSSEAHCSSEGGWADLAFMIDPQGKPFEITIVRSTGNRKIEEAALRAVEHASFEPATLNGQPVESGFEIKYQFDVESNGARPEYVKAYKTLVSAVKAGDRPAADAAMEKLQIKSLYEDAYFGLASYIYAAQWGDESQQIAGLRRAIAQENHAHYLPEGQFRAAVNALTGLELRSNQFEEAIDDWKLLQRLDKRSAEQLRPVIERIEQRRSDPSSYSVSGQMADGTWYLHLFKRHFRVAVGEGYVSQVKLRCDKRYVYFAFDPKLQYEVADKFGKCSIQLEGAPGTRFELIQF